MDEGDNYGEQSCDDVDYYEALGLSRKATADEIRRAYKRKSLELHPDKIRQKQARSLSSSEYEACHARFQRMKEAADCLSDPSKRDLYDALGMVRYKFVQDPSGNLDPATLFDNLGQSNCFDRTKVLVVLLFIVGLIVSQPILICLKTDSILNENGGPLEDVYWYLILTPLWIVNSLVSGLLVIFKRWAWLLQWVCVVALEVLLALRFDDFIDWRYAMVFIPLYVFIVARIADSARWIIKVNKEIDRMITVPFLEKYVLNGNDDDDNENREHGRFLNGNEDEGVRSDAPKSQSEEQIIKSIRREHSRGHFIRYGDLTDEEREKINQVFVIVHIPPDSQELPDSDDDSEDGATENNIYISPEYEQAASVRNVSASTIKHFIFAYIPTVVLIALRLDIPTTNWNWFLVFTPVWVMLAVRLILASFTICCSVAVSEKELIMRAHAAAKDAGQKKEKAQYGTMELDTVEEGNEKAIEGRRGKYINEGKDGVELNIDGLSRGHVIVGGGGGSGSSPTYSSDFGSINELGSIGFGDEQEYEPHFEMDEQVFREAYEAEEEKAQNRAAEAQSKALGVCLLIVLQALLLALFIIKLNKEYDNADGNSYSALWVFSPVLILVSIFMCCVCCAVYAVRDTDQLDGIKVDRQSEQQEEVVEEHDVEDHHTSEQQSQSVRDAYYGGSILDEIADDEGQDFDIQREIRQVYNMTAITDQSPHGPVDMGSDDGSDDLD